MPSSPAALSSAVGLLARQFDRVAGGFGGAPKFPPSMVLEFLLRHHARTGDAPSRDMACRTLEAMSRSGMYDQLAGGFARYAVDAGWVVPHFEKMLYDNALLLRACTTWWKVTRDPLAERIVRETADFVVRDLGTAAGGFASSLDADAAGVEGLTYAWTPEQLREVLGDDGPVAAELLCVTAEGTFEHGASTLQLPTDPGDPDWFAEVRRRLLAARAEPSSARTRRQGRHVVERSRDRRALAVRARPSTARTGSRRPAGAPRHVLDVHVVDGELRRASRLGVVGAGPGRRRRPRQPRGGAARAPPGHGRAAAGSTRPASVLDAARDFAADDGGFHDTARDAEPLYLRPRSAADNAEPSGQSALAGALVTLGAVTGDADGPRRPAPARPPRASGLAVREPRFGGWSLAVAEALVAGPLQVAVAGSGPEADALETAARRSPSPGLVVVRGEPDAPGRPCSPERPRGRRCRGLCLPWDGLRAADDRPRRAGGTAGWSERRRRRDATRWGDAAEGDALRGRTAQQSASGRPNPRILQESPHDGLSAHRGRRRGRRRHP